MLTWALCSSGEGAVCAQGPGQGRLQCTRRCCCSTGTGRGRGGIQPRLLQALQLRDPSVAVSPGRCHLRSKPAPYDFSLRVSPYFLGRCTSLTFSAAGPRSLAPCPRTSLLGSVCDGLEATSSLSPQIPGPLTLPSAQGFLPRPSLNHDSPFMSGPVVFKAAKTLQITPPTLRHLNSCWGWEVGVFSKPPVLFWERTFCRRLFSKLF